MNIKNDSKITAFRNLCYAMNIGERVYVPVEEFEDIFGMGIYPSAIDNFLAGMMGSDYGAFTAAFVWERQHVRICRNADNGGKRVYVSPDRRDLFEQIGDEYVYRG